MEEPKKPEQTNLIEKPEKKETDQFNPEDTSYLTFNFILTQPDQMACILHYCDRHGLYYDRHYIDQHLKDFKPTPEKPTTVDFGYAIPKQDDQEFPKFRFEDIQIEPLINKYDPNLCFMFAKNEEMNVNLGGEVNQQNNWKAKLDLLKIELAKNPPFTEYQYRIPGEMENIVYEWNPMGIFRVRFNYNKDGSLISQYPEPLWQWRDFRITKVLEHNENGMVERKYTGFYNGQEFLDRSIEELKDLLAPECLLNGKHRSKFGPLLLKFVEGENIPVFQCAKECGFTQRGWILPDKAQITMNLGIQTKIRDTLRTMATLPNTTQASQKTKQDFQALYKAITIRYKDVVLAFACISPFLYALRPFTRLMPYLAMGGFKGGTGKTTTAISISTKIWNNLADKEALNKDNLQSESRALEYLSASTFPVLIDDCGELSELVKAEIKAYLTEENYWERKKRDNTILISKPLCASLIFTFNQIPPMFDDTAFLSRGIFIPIEEPPQIDQAKQFEGVFNSIPKGELGRYIYGQTEKMTLQELKELFDAQPDMASAKESRTNTIARLLGMGKVLAKRWFDVDLDLKSVPRLLDETHRLGNEELFALIQDQVLSGSDPDAMKVSHDTYGTETGTYFKPSRSWITIPIKKITHNGVEGYLYEVDNRNDLIKRIGKKDRDLSLEKLVDILRTRWADVQYKNITFEKKTAKRIFIPEKYMIPKDPFEGILGKNPLVNNQKTKENQNQNSEESNDLEIPENPEDTQNAQESQENQQNQTTKVDSNSQSDSPSQAKSEWDKKTLKILNLIAGITEITPNTQFLTEDIFEPLACEDISSELVGKTLWTLKDKGILTAHNPNLFSIQDRDKFLRIIKTAQFALQNT
jgi:hypothetical protein